MLIIVFAFVCQKTPSFSKVCELWEVALTRQYNGIIVMVFVKL